MQPSGHVVDNIGPNRDTFTRGPTGQCGRREGIGPWAEVAGLVRQCLDQLQRTP
jgi:hypothetical protein